MSAGLPSRTAETRTATDCRRRSAAWPALCSCTESSITLSRAIVMMITALVSSPVSAEIPLATISRMTSGFLKRERARRRNVWRRVARRTFGP